MLLNRFADRDDAGKRLAAEVKRLRLADPVVLALPRGGVPVAAPVAEVLGAPLDLVMVRKIGAPGHTELAAGAVVDGAAHQVVWNESVLRSLGLGPADLQPAVEKQLALIKDRRTLYFGGRAPVPVQGRDVVVVDDGIATGATIRAALKGLSQAGAASIVLAVPVAPSDTLAALKPLVDRVICLTTPEPFFAVGQQYQRFDQVTDTEVVGILRRFDNSKTHKGEDP